MTIRRITPESVPAQQPRVSPASSPVPEAAAKTPAQGSYRVTITPEARTRAADAVNDSDVALTAEQIAAHRDDVANGVYDSKAMIDSMARRLVDSDEV